MRTESQGRQLPQPVSSSPSAASADPPAEAVPVVPAGLMMSLHPLTAERAAIAQQKALERLTPERLAKLQARSEEAARPESELRAQREEVCRKTLAECRGAIDQLQQGFATFAAETPYREILEEVYLALKDVGERYVAAQVWRS